MRRACSERAAAGMEKRVVERDVEEVEEKGLGMD